MYNNYGYNPPQYTGYQPMQTPYQPRMDFGQMAQAPQPQQPMQSGLQARPVTGREEAVAATVFPGSPMLFLDRARGAVYYKAIDPQTGAAEFVDFAVVQQAQPVQPPAPQYATLADVDALRDEMAQIRDMIPVMPARKTRGADAE